MKNQNKNSNLNLSGFSKLSFSDRLDKLQSLDLLTSAEASYLKEGGIQSPDLGEKFIENVIGYFQLPMGVATNFIIDGKSYLIPMAVEETSIIAAASKTAKWVSEHGSITTESRGSDIIGQIQFAKVQDFENLNTQILKQKDLLIAEVNQMVASSMVARGGGVSDLKIRRLQRGDGFDMAVIHIYMNPCDAMGANVINQICEYLKEPLQNITGEIVTMCILSNLVDSKLTYAKVIVNNIDAELAMKIEEASRFAELDPYRAATNNKGVLNGIDPILIATGNDWRATEAGIHAFAASSGQYSSITKWRADGRSLVGEILIPLVTGIVGGVTQLHPTAKLALKMLNVSSAEELSRVAAAVGLVQNLGALKALTTVGIIEGHMKLHVKNLMLGAGASEKEMPYVIKKLEEILSLRKRITLSNAVEVLNEFRAKSEHQS